MTRRLVLDRHVFGGAASAYDTAWDTLGWSPGIAGEPAERLAESVPWGTALARMPEPPMLRGPIAQVTGRPNLEGLRVALLPMGEQLGFSVWGAYGRRSAAEWRVLTHTVLLDDAAFRALAGNPFFLLGTGTWLADLAEGESLDARRALPPVVIECDGSIERAAEAHRLREIERLYRHLSDAIGAESAAARVRAVWAALEDGGSVALRPDADAPAVARLAWLALPLEDRAAVPFTTGQARSGRSAARLLVLEAEWGDALPDRTRVVADGPADSDPGTRLWAGSLADAALHRAVSARARARRWSLLRGDVRAAADVLAWQAEWSARGPDPQLAASLMRSASGARGRIAAAGYALGLALRGRHGGPAACARAALDAVGAHAAARSTHALRGVVRGLARSPDSRDRAAAALTRLGGVSSLAPAAELRRLHAQERSALDALVSHPEAVGALCAAGAEAGAEAIVLAAPLVEALARGGAAAVITRPCAWLLDHGVPRALATAVSASGEGSAARALLRALLPVAAARVPVDAATQDALLRIAWVEYDPTGSTSVVDLAHTDPHGSVGLLAQLLVAPAPLPLFLRIRRALLEAAAAGVRAPLPARAAEASPALARALAGESSREALVLIEGA